MILLNVDSESGDLGGNRNIVILTNARVMSLLVVYRTN